MDDEDESGGLLNIEVSDTEQADDPAVKKAQRTDQTEQEFQAVQREYSVKVENGNIHKHIKLPLPKDAKKIHLQEVIHAVEELYFFRRYHEAVLFLEQVLDGESRTALDRDTLALLEKYRVKCRKRQEDCSA